MGNRQSKAPLPSDSKAGSRSSEVHKQTRKPRKQKAPKKKDFQILADHRPPGYTRDNTAERSGLHSDLLRRQLDEMNAQRTAATAVTFGAKGDQLPTYEDAKGR
ncbi:hypothetical protein IAT40_001922 [Kwoniella sp. CBS 6097]